MKTKSPRRNFHIRTIIVLLFSLLNACSLWEIQQQANLIESTGGIQGTIITVTANSAPIIVNRYRLQGKTYITDSFTRVSPDGHFSFTPLPGTYYLAAFIDRNKDGNHQWSEQAAIYSLNNGKPSPILVTAGHTITLNNISIKGKLKKSDSDYQSKVKLSWGLQNIGRIITLDNDMFAPENYSTGLWKPFHFLEHIGGGLFFLQPYDASKVPVLFIHGINGGPKDWEHAISLLDEQHFQAWILYYPTGFRLDMISDYLLKAIPRLQDQFAFKKIIIAAHSMGGLVARSFIKKYTQNHPDLAQSLCLLVTVNSPLGGMESAALGVQTLPIVLPVWRDLDPDSPFLAELNKWVWPNNIPYHLFFSYISGESGDNVVQLKKQIPLKIQSDATRLYGLNDSHVGTLHNDEFLNLFNLILSKQH